MHILGPLSAQRLPTRRAAPVNLKPEGGVFVAIGRTRPLAPATALVALLFGFGVAVPAHAAPPSVDISDSAETTVGEPTSYVVVGTGISRQRPVTILWGDGTAQLAKTACTKKRAKKRPKKCRIRVGHVYATPGIYSVLALDGDLLLATGSVRVTGNPDDDRSRPRIEESPQWRSEIIDAVNSVRAQNGRAAVGACPRLDRVSQQYAQVMADTGHYDHTGPNGESPWDRMRAGGYDYRAAGENIAYGYPTAAEVHTGWVESDGHFRNMINGRVTDIGLGAAQSETGRWYWVQMFGAGGNCSLNAQSVDTPAPVTVMPS